MRVATAHEKMAYDIGFDIGHSTDEVQARLLNGLFKPFKDYEFQDGMQMSYISDKLDTHTKEMIIKLSNYCRD